MNTTKTICALLLSACFVPLAYAEPFAGVDISYSQDDNFNGAPAGGIKLTEEIMSYSAYLGTYVPRANRHSAWIFKGDAAANRLSQASQIDNNIYGMSGGYFHRFSKAHSLTTNLGARAKRFDDARRDGEVYSASLGLKQNTSATFWFREGISYEYGTAKVKSGEYNGYGVNGSLNWKATSSTLLTAGLNWNKRLYDVLVADERTGTQGTLSLVQELGKHAYLRGSLTRQKNSTNAGNEYESTVYGLGIGFTM